MLVSCDNCAKDFQKEPNRIARSKNNFCSSQCKKDFPVTNPPKITIECAFCKNIFSRKESETKRSKKIYCSHECSNRGKRKRSLVCCAICERSFEKHDKDIKRSNGHYCSRECWNKKRAERNILCIQCNLIIDTSTTRYSKKYCKVCYAARYKEKYPESYNKHEKHKVRIKRNLPLDHPPLRINHVGQEGWFTANGYRKIYRKGHPNSKDKNGSILEHVYVMSEFLGRPIQKHENIHHKNGIRYDNRIENLELWCRGQPGGQRVKDRIEYYVDFLQKYGVSIDLSTIPKEFADNEP
jgi:hypothetical protein